MAELLLILVGAGVAEDANVFVHRDTQVTTSRDVENRKILHECMTISLKTLSDFTLRTIEGFKALDV